MKKLLLLCLVALMYVSVVDAQQIEKNFVLLEKGTGTWCVWCPSAAQGAKDMIEEGHKLAVVSYHGGDDFQIPSGYYRLQTYYDISGYPTNLFDGDDTGDTGGSSTGTTYSSFFTRFNAKMAILTSFDIQSEITYTSGTTGSAEITIDQVAAYDTSADLRLHVVVTESNIYEGGSLFEYVDNAVRAMIPDQFGTSITAPGAGSSVTETISINLDPSWDPDQIRIVAFLQNNATKEVLNTDRDLLVAPESLDAQLYQVEGVNSTQCGTDIGPSIKLRNVGSTDMTEAVIEYSVNGAAPSTYTWTGMLSFEMAEVVTLPAASYTATGTNTLDIDITSVNGTTDDDITNNAKAFEFTNPRHSQGWFKVMIQPDDYGAEITWNIANSAGFPILSGGPYTNGDLTLIQDSVEITGLDQCYTFNLMDSYGDGLTYGTPGWARFYNASNNIVFTDGGESYSAMEYNYRVEDAVGVADDLEGISFSILPNPSNGLFNLEITSDRFNDVTYKVFSMSGQVLAEGALGLNSGTNVERIDISDAAAGIYFLSLQNETGATVQKLIVR